MFLDTVPPFPLTCFCMGEVFELKIGKRFTLQEANALLPVIKKITAEAVHQVELLKARVEEIDPEPSHRPYYEQELGAIVDHWSQKILKLGCQPKGLWVVDFDNGEGFYCWHHPEEAVEYSHTYDGGFQNRVAIA